MIHTRPNSARRGVALRGSATPPVALDALRTLQDVPPTERSEDWRALEHHLRRSISIMPSPCSTTRRRACPEDEGTFFSIWGSTGHTDAYAAGHRYHTVPNFVGMAYGSCMQGSDECLAQACERRSTGCELPHRAFDCITQNEIR